MKFLRMLCVQLRQMLSWKLFVYGAVFALVQTGGALGFMTRDEFTSVWYIVYLGTTTGMSFLTLYILPTLLFSMSLQQDWENHATPYWTVRAGVSNYTVAKLLTGAAAGFLTVGIGLLLWIFALRAAQYPWFVDAVGDTGYEAALLNGNIFAGFAGYILHYALSGAIIGMFGMFITVFIQNAYAGVAAPLSLHLTFSRLLSNTPTSPTSVWHLNNWVVSIHTAPTAGQTLLEKLLLTLLLFADTVEIDSYTNLMLVRIGRVPYILGYQLYILAASFLYTVVQVLLSVLFILPVIGFDADWGVLIRTLAGSAGQVATQTGSTLSFVVSNEILSRFTPLKAMLVNFLCIWLSTAFVGFVICFFRIFFSKAAAVIVVGVLICLSLFVRFLGGMLIGTWLQYFSPLTWSNFAYLDWYYSGAAPSPAYAFTVWIGGIVLFGAASAIGFCKRDVRQTGR